MSTDSTQERGARSAGPYEDLRLAIASTAFIEAKSGATIIGSEKAGVRDAWIFDFRALMLQPQWLDRFAEIFWDLYGSRLPFQVGGVETAGIPLVTAIVMKSVERGTPVNGFYIRKSRKRQGLMKYIEGTLTDEPIVFVDDLINSGQSVSRQIDILAQAGKRVTDVFTLLAFRSDNTYGPIAQRGVSLRHLFELSDFGLTPQKTPKEDASADAFEVLWHYRGPTPSFHIVLQKSAPVLDEARVYFGRDDGIFCALERTSGRVAWEFPVGRHPAGKGILSTPVLHEGVVYFGAYDGCTYALEAATGRLIWRNDEADWVGSSPELADDIGLLYIGLEFGLIGKRGGIGALDKRTGKTLWRASHPSLTHGSPLYIKEESLVVIGSNDGILYAYDAKTGTMRWRCAARSDIKTKAAYDATRRAVLFPSMDGVLYAVSALDGTPMRALETNASIYSIPLVDGDNVYVASLDKCVYALDLASWKERWRFETGGRIFASPLLHAGSLWVGSNDGKLYEIEPRTGTKLSSFQFTERIVNRIVASGDTLYVPTVANEMYCIKKKLAPRTS